MRLRTLGGLALEGAGFTRQKPLLLLSYLALEGTKDRRFLSELLWLNTANPRNSLATALSRLRRNAPGVVGADEARAWAIVECDAVGFLSALDRDRLADAVEAYEGPFLLGVDLGGSGVEFEEWVYGTREFIANRVRAALIRLAESAAGEGEVEEAARLAERAYLLAGAPEPEPDELIGMHRLLLVGESPRAAEIRREAASFGITLDADRDAAWEVLARRTGAGSATDAGLLESGTSFVGREAELAELTKLLSREGIRLLTIAGPGGVGKTRLALQLARRLQERFPDGVHFVPLEAVTNPELIPGAIATRLDLSLHDGGDRVAQLARFIGEKRVLLVLDNFEHLLDGAAVASELLRACSNLAFLVTSRERLNLAEEAVFPLEGLISALRHDAPRSEEPYRDAVELFAQRAKSADLRFSLTPEVLAEVIRICELVGGSPLGIELAAVWVKSMPPAEIAWEVERNLDFLESPLQNVRERQRSLRTVFEYSWGLLTPREREFLGALSVFRGGFRREAATVVTGASIPVLAALVDKSFLRVLPSGRYDRHPLVLQYSSERLAEHPEKEWQTRERHGRFFLELVEAGEPKFRTAEDRAWLEQLDEEQDNIRAALQWMRDAEEIEAILRLGAALWWFWRTRGLVQEGAELLRTALSHPAARGRTAVRATALTVVSNLLHRLGDAVGASPFGEESIDIWRDLGDDRGLALALLNQGGIEWRLGNTLIGRAMLEESLERARKVGYARYLPQILGNLAALVEDLGDRDRAKRLALEVYRSARATGNSFLHRVVAHGFGRWEMEEGRYDRARAYFEESLALIDEVGEQDAVPAVLARRAELSYRMNAYPEARSLCEEALIRAREFGNRQVASWILGILGEVLLIQGEIAAARALFEEIHAIGRETGLESGVAEALIRLGKIHLVTGDYPRARSSLEQGLETARPALALQALHGLGSVAWAEGEFAEARSRFEACLALARKTPDRRDVALILHGLGMVAGSEGNQASAQTHFEQSLEIHLQLGDRYGVATVLEGCAGLASEAEPLRAARLWGAAEAVREAIGAPLLPDERSRYERDLASVRGRVAESAFSSAWAGGREMTLSEAAAFALDRNSAE